MLHKMLARHRTPSINSCTYYSCYNLLRLFKEYNYLYPEIFRQHAQSPLFLNKHACGTIISREKIRNNTTEFHKQCAV